MYDRIKKTIFTILPPVMVVVFVLIFTLSPFGGHTVHADGGNLFGLSLEGMLFSTLSWMAYISLTFMSWVVAIAALLLNSAVTYGILNMQKEVQAITTINDAWTIFRDLGNLVFIFIILYVAIATILDLGGIDTKRVIRNIIIVGLLVNFSLFFTKVLIDASNIVAINFYSQILKPGATFHDFAATFTGPLGITSVLSAQDFQQHFVPPSSTNSTGSSLAVAEVGLGGTIILGMVAISFIFAAILIVSRFVILLVLMMLSPFAFFMFILPQTKQYADKWWSQLRNQLVFAPMYMLLLYVVVQLNNTLNLTNGTTSVSAPSATSNLIFGLSGLTAATSAGGTTPLDLLLRFLVMIFFLNLAIILSLSAASNSGAIVSGIVNRVRGGMVNVGKRTVNTVKTGATAAGGAVAGGSVRAVSSIASSVGKSGSRRASDKLDAKEDDLKRKAIDPNAYGFQRWNAKRQLAGLEAKAKPFREKREKESEEVLADTKKYGAARSETLAKVKTAKDAVTAARERLADVVANPRATPAERQAANASLRGAQETLSRHERTKERETKEQQAQHLRAMAKNRKAPKYKEAYKKFNKSVKPATEAEASKIEAEEFADQIRDNIGDATFVKNVLNSMGSDQIKNLPGSVLREENVMKVLDVPTLEALQKAGKLKPQDRQTIGAYIKSQARAEGTDSQVALHNYLNTERSKNFWGPYSPTTGGGTGTARPEASTADYF